MCHIPKLESGYNDKRIFPLVTYCAWFQGFSNTSLTFPSIPTTFATVNPFPPKWSPSSFSLVLAQFIPSCYSSALKSPA